MSQTASVASEIPDTQNTLDTRHIAIDKVGIKNIKHPVVVSDRSGREQHTVANFNMYVIHPDINDKGISTFSDINMKSKSGLRKYGKPYKVIFHYTKIDINHRFKYSQGTIHN